MSAQAALSDPVAVTADLTPIVVVGFWGQVDRSGGVDACWPWEGSKNVGGYGTVRAGRDLFIASRLACEVAHGKPREEEGRRKYALHSCDNPSCCNPRHLRWGSAQENTRDMLARGRGYHQQVARARREAAEAAATAEAVSF